MDISKFYEFFGTLKNTLVNNKIIDQNSVENNDD